MDQDYSMILVWDKLSRSSRERLLEWAKYHYKRDMHMGMLALLSISTVLEVLSRVGCTAPYKGGYESGEVQQWRSFLLEAIHKEQQREHTEAMRDLMYNRRVS